ncbi:MAG: CotH kinase family protein [bacterium]|nr:CotH kinase family protein [bacterium]
MLKNHYFRIVKSRIFKNVLKFLVVCLIVGAAVALGFTGKFKTAERRAQFLLGNPAVTKILPLYWQIRKLSDVTYLSYVFSDDDILDYKLVIADADLKKMNDSLPKGFMNVIYRDEDRVSVPAEFEAEGKIYKVRVRYRGANAVHWNAPKRSYLVRFDKDDLFHGLRELSFIIPDDRLFAVEHFNNYRAEKLGLKIPQSGFANLVINGQKKALYFTIEGWSREMLTKWEVSENSILYGNIASVELWSKPANWELLADNPNLSETQNFETLASILRLLNEASDQEFYNKIFHLVDKENFYAWNIHQELANSSHQSDDNVRLYYDAVARKFFFVPWDVEIESPELRDNFRVYGALEQRIFTNPIFLQEKNQRLLDYLSDEKNLEDDLNFYDQTYENFKVSLYHDRLKIYTNRFADKTHEQNRQKIIDIFHYLQQTLESQSSGDPGAARVEDDFNLAYDTGKSDEIVSYLQGKYIEDKGFMNALGSNFTATYGDEDFTDTYFDTPKLDLYGRKAGLRYRVRVNRLNPEDSKSGQELIQLKLSSADKFTDIGNTGSRNEIKFDVERPKSLESADDRDVVMSLIATSDREEYKARIRELGIDPYDIRPILTISQHRRRVYLNRDGETFISFSVDDAKSSLWWADSEFSQMEVELNELAYTGADEATRVRMQEIRKAMIADLRGQFDYLADDKTIKYTKMLDLLDEHLPWMKFLIRVAK